MLVNIKQKLRIQTWPYRPKNVVCFNKCNNCQSEVTCFRMHLYASLFYSSHIICFQDWEAESFEINKQIKLYRRFYKQPLCIHYIGNLYTVNHWALLFKKKITEHWEWSLRLDNHSRKIFREPRRKRALFYRTISVVLSYVVAPDFTTRTYTSCIKKTEPKINWNWICSYIPRWVNVEHL